MMDREIVYADLALEPGKRRRNPSSLPQPGTSGCPQWHRTALWAGWTGNLLLGVAVVAMGCSRCTYEAGTACFAAETTSVATGLSATVQFDASVSRVRSQAGGGVLHQWSENPGSCRNMTGNMSRNIGDDDATLKKVYSELREVFCSSKPQEDKGCTLCPMNWMSHGTKCYWVSNELSRWNSSREDCVNQGGQLMMPEDQEELDFINRTLQKPTRYFWIGLFFEKGWTWVNGSHLDPSRFQLNLRAEGGSCGVIREGRISTIGCRTTLQWICQKEATQL